jgi:uncharacterized protein YgiM (DUF1202 family)
LWFLSRQRREVKLMRCLNSCAERSTRLLVATFLAVVILVQPAAAELSPYETRVATPRAQVRSGPGEKFYPTDTLDHGDTVEVYREEPGGWLAIRPPENSFSWIEARHLKLRDGALAEVAQDGIASRIGSRISDQRNAAQVRLKKGEVVEIIEQPSAGWYKIAPPAGEFRWIHATNVESNRAASSPTPQSPAEQPVVAASATNDASSDAKPIPAAPEPPITPAVAGLENSWRTAPPDNHSTTPAAQSEIAPPPLSPLQAVAEAAPPTSSAPQPMSAATPSTPLTATAPNSASVAPTSATAVSSPPAANYEAARQLADIELRLSRMAAAPPHLWNTERLERDAERLLDDAQTTAERDAVKVTLAKIDRFRSLSRQYQQGAGSQNPKSSLADAGQYDAIGTLRPVISKRPGAPQFAVVDDQGQVISFVTPAPDVNLQSYVGHRVGINGNRGFIPEFNRAHVTAGRVTPLNDRLLR